MRISILNGEGVLINSPSPFTSVVVGRGYVSLWNVLVATTLLCCTLDAGRAPAGRLEALEEDVGR